MGKGKHQRTDDSKTLIVIDICFSLIKSLFYHHKIINFMYPFVLEQINLGELLTENMIIYHKVTNTKKAESQKQASVWPV